MPNSKDYNLSTYIGNKIKQFRTERGLTTEELADKLGTSRVTVTRYENGTRKANQDVLFDLANIFNKTLDDFFPVKEINYTSETSPEYNDSLNEDKRTYVVKHDYPSNSLDTSGMHYVRVPIVGTIACGTPITAEQNIEGYTHELFESEPAKGELFALRCQGDSMEPLIPDGALVLIHKQPTVEDDEIAAVQVDDDTRATLKKIKHVGKNVILYPINSKYDPIILNKDNPGRILGKAIHVGFDM